MQLVTLVYKSFSSYANSTESIIQLLQLLIKSNKITSILNDSIGFPPSHQNKIPWYFPDIPGKFLKILDGASSVYLFSGQLHSPYTDHLRPSFNARISSFRHIQYLQLMHVSMWQFFIQSLRLLSVTNANH